MSKTYAKSGPIALKANIMEYLNTKAMRAGAVTSDLVSIDFCGPAIANQGFKPMIREARFDTSELAIVSFLQAREAGKPLVLLPVPILSRFQHHCISYNCTKGDISPKDVEGKRVGLRSYSQTTALWVRAILQHEYGVDLGRITWVSYDPPHPAEVSDPPFVEKYVPDQRSVEEMLADGAFDAAIVGTEIRNEPRVKPLITDPHTKALAWYKRFGVVPVNHYLVVGRDLSEQRPDVVGELYRICEASKNANPLTAGGVDLLPMGLDANRKSLEAVIMYANEQGLIKTQFKVDDLFDATTRKLGQ